MTEAKKNHRVHTWTNIYIVKFLVTVLRVAVVGVVVVVFVVRVFVPVFVFAVAAPVRRRRAVRFSFSFSLLCLQGSHFRLPGQNPHLCAGGRKS